MIEICFHNIPIIRIWLNTITATPLVSTTSRQEIHIFYPRSKKSLATHPKPYDSLLQISQSLPRPNSIPSAMHPLELPLRKPRRTLPTPTITHKIIKRVIPGVIRTRIHRRALIPRRRVVNVRWGVGDHVVGGGAGVLEGVVEVEPVA